MRSALPSPPTSALRFAATSLPAYCLISILLTLERNTSVRVEPRRGKGHSLRCGVRRGLQIDGYDVILRANRAQLREPRRGNTNKVCVRAATWGRPTDSPSHLPSPSPSPSYPHPRPNPNPNPESLTLKPSP